ncbi:MAG: hypothetical protein GY925_06645 [Actinomycetia bacterium]|nr:hypothetical protein [Actinomycetes bacterium]
MPRSAVICAVCHRLRVHGVFSDEGDVFICTQCQADAKQFIAIQDSIWSETTETGESIDATDKPEDP